MVYVKRDQKHQIIAIFNKDTGEHLEKLDATDKEVQAFMTQCHLNDNDFLKSDIDLIRVIEDLIQILIAKMLLLLLIFPSPPLRNSRYVIKSANNTSVFLASWMIYDGQGQTSKLDCVR
jgi:hypothetical protein